MSGHEKFYIPHDDLEALKTAIESLETSINTLDTTIQDTLKERYELVELDTHTVTDTNGEVLVRNAVLSADKDCFIRRVTATVELDTLDPLSLYNSDIALGVGVSGGTLAVADMVFGDSRRPALMSTVPVATYKFYRTWYVNDHKIAANVKLLVDAYFCNIRVDTVFSTVICYVEDVYG